MADDEDDQDLLRSSVELIQKLRRDLPEPINAFLNFTQKAKGGQGALDEKVKNLILVALAVNQQCEDCMVMHLHNAVDSGATRQEILEACLLAMVAAGGSKLVQMKTIYAELEFLQR
ncbi:MAG: carboxymuconolactone decarboxylase family protein [Magnetococcales bacterium]|nr:carboxymuconolactone decarboxylase family protein [Magnetococcales bacterium]